LGKTSKKLFTAILSFIIGESLLGQNLKHSKDQTYEVRVPVELVLVPVTVEDKEGRLIYDLQKEDFEIYEDGVRQKLI
jgi:hypothetical protein